MHRSLVMILIISGNFTFGLTSTNISFIGDPVYWGTFTDSLSGGHSINPGIAYSDSAIQWITELRSGNFQWPYTGIIRDVRSGQCRCTDLDTLVLEVKSTYEGNADLLLCTFDPGITKVENPLSYRNLKYTFKITQEKNRIFIPLKEFKVAGWWKVQNNVSLEDNRKFLDSLCFIELIVNDKKRINHTDTISIFQFYIKSKGSQFPWAYLIIALTLVICGWLMVVMRKDLKRKSGKLLKSDTLQLHPQKINADPSDWQRTISYMEKNYASSDLSIQKMAKELGFSDSKLSKLINENYPNGYRSLVHDLRILEGKRMLKDSDMNIADIAYKLGYANVSHFNHEFKKKAGLTPTAFRRQD